MVEILRNKNLATRFQILVEIADSGSNIQQREIARKLDITPQAISDYIVQLTNDGLLTVEGRSRYKVTNEGVNWTIKALRELSRYSTFVNKAVTNISVCAAVSDCSLAKGQAVSLEMKDGLLVATDQTSEGAKGIAISDAGKGQDVGVTSIEGIVALKIGKVTILKVPNIQRGGSRKVNIGVLLREIKGKPVITAIGIESLVALRQASVNFYIYGAKEITIEAAQSGLQPLVVCVEDELSNLIKSLETENISYELVDIEKD